MKYIVLLRGVTPTGKNKVPMAELRQQLEKAGLSGVQTYIQSGNVLIDTNLNKEQLETMIHDVILRSFGGDLTVIALTPREIRTVLEKNPFSEGDIDKMYFSFLATKPDQQLVDELMSNDFSPDQVAIVGSVVYTLYEVKLSTSKWHNNTYERKLKVRASTRNFNTTTKLLQLADEL